MAWYLNPIKLARAVSHARAAFSGGGPKAVRVTGIRRPEGVVFPVSTVSVEVERKDGTVARFAPELPAPWPYAWGYRLGRWLGVPVLSGLDPEAVNFRFAVPRGESRGKR